jgi:hypothetical protein
MRTVKSIQIGERLPILQDRDRELVEYWKKNGRINLTLLERIRIIKLNTQKNEL